MTRNLIGRLGLGGSIVGFAGAVFVFARVQVLQAYPFHDGVYGNQALLFGVTYTAGLEIFSCLALIGLFSRTYARAAGGPRERLIEALGFTLLVSGILAASVVYVETSLLWGNLAPGIHLWGGLSGGGGYPWGTERVAYNTCFISSKVQGDCTFLNYNELFWLALLCALLGFVLMYWPKAEPGGPNGRWIGDPVPLRSMAQRRST